MAVSTNSAGKDSPSPNILVIYADDLGYGDVGCYNPQRGKILTPSMDRLASEGMRFTDAHSSSGVCSPSRYTLLTGRYHWRSRLQKGIVDRWEKPLITPDRMTIAGLVKQQGYQTYAIGKWHLGWNWPFNVEQSHHFNGFSGFEGKSKTIKMRATATEENREVWSQTFMKPITGGPTVLGFDYYFGTDVPNWPPFCFIENDHTVEIPSELLNSELVSTNMASFQGPSCKGWKLESILPTICDKAIAIIKREADSGKPFLMYMALTSPHTPLAVSEEWKNKSGLSNPYADFVTQTDSEIGRVLKALENNGLAENTLVIFTSDNGCGNYVGIKDLEEQGHFVSGPLRGYKGEVWEGGHRVPFIVRLPGVVKPGTVCGQLVHQADIMATLADLLDMKLPDDAGEDSFSLLQLLKGANKPVRESAISTSALGVQAIRSGCWKLICTEQPQLYDLCKDIREAEDLAAGEPQLVKKMMELRERIIKKGRSTKGSIQKNDVEVIH